MKGDFSRLTFDSKKHFSAVRMQQGRVQLDADWNEQLDISQHRLAMQMTDFIGYRGVPAQVDGQDNSFKITPDGNAVKIGAGRIYIAGELYENEEEVNFTDQADYPGATLPTTSGTYLAYLDVWARHITPLEDAEIREIALGGPDTTTRIKNLWQVKLQQVNNSATPAEFDANWNPNWVEAISTGEMMARVNGTSVTLENQLYRVEIHQGGTADQATFKWSRDNGSVAAKVESIVGKTINISSAGRDPEMGFAAGQWVELCSEEQSLSGQPGTFVRLERVQEKQLIVVNWPANSPPSAQLVRRWDSQETNSQRGDLLLSAGPDDWTLLEDEIQVQFETDPGKVYKTGDYWLIPARHLTSDIEWPRDNNNDPQYQPAHGIQHHYAALALLEYNGSNWTLKANGDLRTKFNPLIGGFVNKAGDTMSGALHIQNDLRVDGKVGIGTTNPHSKLSVSGGVGIGSGYVSTTAPHNGLMVQGRVGIGTTNPSQMLSLESTGPGSIYLKGNTNNTSHAMAATLILESNIDYRGRGIFLRRSDVGDNQDPNGWFVGVPYTGQGFQIGHSDTETSQSYRKEAAKLFINKTGQVSIGTANPGSFKLAVDGDLRADKYVVQNGVDGGSSRGIFMWNANDSNWGFYMGQSGANKSLADGEAVAGAGFTSHALRLRTTSSITQGLIVENSSEQLNLSVRGSDGLTYIRGKVGIETTDPKSKLSVSGGVGIGSSYAGSNAAPTDGLIVQGNVGIGTTQPTAKLEVNGTFKAISIDSGERKLLMEPPSDGDHRGDSTQNATGLAYRVETNPSDGDPIFQVRSSGQAVRLFVEHEGWTGSKDNSAWFGGSRDNYFAGDVGIGTTDPQSKLSVSGGVGIGSSYAGSNAAPTDGLIVQGNVGIGTASPTTKLEVNGTVKATSFQGDGSSLTGISTGKWSGGTNIYYNGGNVGIGTTNPGAKLDVRGDIKFGSQGQSYPIKHNNKIKLITSLFDTTNNTATNPDIIIDRVETHGIYFNIRNHNPTPTNTIFMASHIVHFDDEHITFDSHAQYSLTKDQYLYVSQANNQYKRVFVAIMIYE